MQIELTGPGAVLRAAASVRAAFARSTLEIAESVVIERSELPECGIPTGTIKDGVTFTVSHNSGGPSRVPDHHPRNRILLRRDHPSESRSSLITIKMNRISRVINHWDHNYKLLKTEK